LLNGYHAAKDGINVQNTRKYSRETMICGFNLDSWRTITHTVWSGKSGYFSFSYYPTWL